MSPLFTWKTDLNSPSTLHTKKCFRYSGPMENGFGRKVGTRNFYIRNLQETLKVKYSPSPTATSKLSGLIQHSTRHPAMSSTSTSYPKRKPYESTSTSAMKIP